MRESVFISQMSGYIKSRTRLKYIHVVPYVFIWKVNWLYYLNYEAISYISSTCC